MARKSHDDIVKELNREKRYPDFTRTHDFKMLVFTVLIICAALFLVVIILQFKEWIDKQTPLLGIVIVITSLSLFAYWSLWGRKR